MAGTRQLQPLFPWRVIPGYHLRLSRTMVMSLASGSIPRAEVLRFCWQDPLHISKFSCSWAFLSCPDQFICCLESPESSPLGSPPWFPVFTTHFRSHLSFSTKCACLSVSVSLLSLPPFFPSALLVLCFDCMCLLCRIGWLEICDPSNMALKIGSKACTITHGFFGKIIM